MNRFIVIVIFAFWLVIAASCRGDEVIFPTEGEFIVDFPSEDSSIGGFYLLNEGNMGSNKCTLDRFNYFTGLYQRNIYSEANPGAVMELGDVGNDISIYGSKLYIVVNCSHKVEVLDASTAKRLAQIDIPNCRYICFEGENAYVSSYIGPVGEDPNCPLGAVFRLDTLSLSITGECTVGYQPEEMAVVDGRLYVANSGGYRPPYYDSTVSEIDLTTFCELRKIEVAKNLHHVKKDGMGRLWVSSRGERESSAPGGLYLLAPDSLGEMTLSQTFKNMSVTNFAIHGENLYYFYAQGQGNAHYGTFDIMTCKDKDSKFIDEETASRIKMPYAIDVHPETGDIFLSDARNYVSSGTLYCLSPSGRVKWDVRTGDIPAAITFIPRGR